MPSLLTSSEWRKAFVLLVHARTSSQEEPSPTLDVNFSQQRTYVRFCRVSPVASAKQSDYIFCSPTVVFEGGDSLNGKNDDTEFLRQSFLYKIFSIQYPTNTNASTKYLNGFLLLPFYLSDLSTVRRRSFYRILQKVRRN